MVCSFAGGKSDPSDCDVVATALREAREELGVHVTPDSVWGVLKPLRDWVSALVTVLTFICDKQTFLEGTHCRLVSCRIKCFHDSNDYCLFLSHQSGMMIAPVLANLGPIEDLTFKPNPGEVQLFIFNISVSKI